MKRKVLIVDRDKEFLPLLTIRLQSAGFAVSYADNSVTALEMLAAEAPSVVLIDLNVEATNELSLFERVNHLYPAIPIIILTVPAVISDAESITQQGAFASLTKPVDRKELIDTVNKALFSITEDLGTNSGQSENILPLTQAKAEFEKNYVKKLLTLSAGNIPNAARIAGRNRSDFYKIVKRHHLETKHYKIIKSQDDNIL